VPRPFRPADIRLIRQVTDVDAHPDGRRAVYSVGWADEKTDANRSVLRLVDLDGGDRPLTHGHSDVAPRFSPDGRHVAFRRNEPDEPAQLVVLDLEGGEPRTVTELADGVVDHVWLPDGSGLIVTAPVRPPDQVGVERDELARRPRRIVGIDYRFNGRGWIHDRRLHLFRISIGVDDVAVTQLTDGDSDDTEPAVHPAGTVVAFASNREPNASLVAGSDVWTVSVDGGEPTRLTGGDGNWSSPVWTPNGPDLVVLGHPGRNVVRLERPHLLPTVHGRPLPLDGSDASGNGIAALWPRPLLVDSTGEAVYSAGLRRGATHVDRHPIQPGGEDSVAETVIDGPVWVTAAALAPAGTLWFAAGSASRPVELHVLEAERTDGGVGVGQQRRLTSLSDEFLAEVDLAEPTDFEVTSADGTRVHGWILRPPASAPGVEGAARPGLVYVHGGPGSQYGWHVFDEFQVAAGAGYVVVAGNPRGSDGYGEAWLADVVGAFGQRDFEDITALADHLAAQPDVDPDRIGIGGGSYGGFMASWAVGHTDRFGAALVERAVTSFASFVGTSDIGVPFVEAYLGPGAATDPERLQRHSPLTHASRIRTPTMLLHSEEDWRCPPEQAEQLFVALALAGTPAELVRMPDENHELTRGGRPSHRVERFHLVHDWFARHLGGAPTRSDGDDQS
jgi:dipeptidyl aminopeptidase/acylaminoacyl peptidase